MGAEDADYGQTAAQLWVDSWHDLIQVYADPFADCHVVAVKPEHQRKGAGALLTQWGLDIAEQLQLPVYLESSPQARRLYSKLGFSEVGKVSHEAAVLEEKEDVEIPLLVKMPSTLKESFEEWRSKHQD